MAINIKIEKRDLWLLVAVVVFLVAAGFVVAYNSNWQNTPSPPATSVHGHSPDEIRLPVLSSDPPNPAEGVMWICEGAGC